MRNRWRDLALWGAAFGMLVLPLDGTAAEPSGRRHPPGRVSFGRSFAPTLSSARILVETQPGEAGAAACGNSILDAGEECDDGNATPGDGCSDSCQIESGFTCTEPIPPGLGTNVVADPSFEAGTGDGVPENPVWTEFSSSFGTPICNIAFCGDGGGFGPLTGDWWAWFGGQEGGTETASLSQSLVIPATATTLELALEQIVCDSGEDLFEVTLDGVMPPLFSSDGDSSLCGMSGYSTQSLDISAFADGSSHTLELSAQTFSTNDGATNFFVDDVVISDNVPLPPVPSECFEVGPLGCDGSLVDFDNPSPGIPGDWTVIDNASSGPVWTDRVTSGLAGNYTDGTGDAASVSSFHFGAAEFDTELRAPLDLSVILPGATATLSYLANYQNSANSDFLDLDISTDGGTSWTTLLSWNDDHGSPFSTPGESVTVDLSAYAGQGGLLLRWRYHDPNTGDWAQYAQIENVQLSCPPTIQVAPASLATNQKPDTQEMETLTLTNLGFDDLTWSIDETPTLCAAPADVSWLSLAPTNGTISGGDGTQVDVTLDATGLAVGDHEALLCIDSNGAAGPEVEVPVTMTIALCTPAECDDGVTCTDDSCDPAIGCSNTPNDANCDNGLFCDGDETCDAVADCQAGLPPICDDAEACTLDECNEASDMCDHTTIVDLVVSDATLAGGEFVAELSITAGPNLLIDGPVSFTAGDSIIFVGGVEIRDGFSATIQPAPCP